ncbi:MAG: beta-galactosidase [Candidatus Omnitrophica bacterium]|nr:beta-galactosidase [Candidatus Omnitrophota bacterium]
MKGTFFIFIFISFSLYSLEKHNGDYLNKLTTSYVTDHLNWAKPYSAGKIKVLFLVPRHGAREVIEIWQRLDIDFEAFILFYTGLIAHDNVYEATIEGTSTYEKKQELLSKLEKDYDVIIFGHVNFEALPPEAQYKILEKVKNGSGLVFFYNPNLKIEKTTSNPIDKTEEIIRNFPFLGLCWSLQKIELKNLIKTYMFGKGKIVIFNYPEDHSTWYDGLSLTNPIPYNRFWKAYYENNMVLIAKTIIWAGNKKTTVFIENKNFQNGDTFFQESFPKNFDFSISGKKNEKLVIYFRLRDEWNEVNLEKKFSIENVGEKKQINFSIPFLKAGKYFLDFIISSKKGTLDFGFYTFNVNSEVGKTEIQTDKISYMSGEKIKLNINLEKPLKQNTEILIQITDSFKKKVWFQKNYLFPKDIKNKEFEVEISQFPGLCGYLECLFINGKNILLKLDKELFFPKREKEIFPSIVWNGMGSYLREFYLPRIVDAGFIACLGHNPHINAPIEAKFNLKNVPYSFQIGLFSDENGWTQQRWPLFTSDPKNKEKYKGDGSFYNPIIQEEAEKSLLEIIKDIPLYKPFIYSLGDENYFDYNGGYSPSEEKAFKSYLKEKYQTIENLNREWETSFKNFEEVRHYKLEEAKREKKYASAYDHKFFMEKQYADYHHYLANFIKSIDPDAIVGAEGSSPGNLEYTISKLDFWGPYENKVENEVLRCIGKDKLRTVWWGGYTKTHGGRDIYPYPLWSPLLCGIINGNSWYNAGPSSEGFIACDYTYAKYFQEMLPRLQKLYEGLGHLLVVNPLTNDGIAIHWSHLSNSLTFIDGELQNPSSSISTIIDTFYRYGINFDFLTTNMIEEGKLSNYKILFLFSSYALTEKESDRIKEFVKNGGLLISDFIPGIFNGYGRYLGKTSLADIFQIQPVQEIKKTKRGKIEIEKVINGEKIKFSSNQIQYIPDSEIFKIVEFGKGKAILLNFSLSSALTSSSLEDIDNFILQILKIKKVIPYLNLEVEKKIPEQIIVRIRENKRCKILGILFPKETIGKNFRIKLNEERYVYQANEKFLFKKREWSDKINQPFLIYSLFAESQNKPLVKINSSIFKLGEKIVLTMPGAKDGDIYRIVVYNQKEQIYKKIVSLNNIYNTLEIPIAYNEKTGIYNLEITDMLTGLKENIKIKILQ